MIIFPIKPQNIKRMWQPEFSFSCLPFRLFDLNVWYFASGALGKEVQWCEESYRCQWGGWAVKQRPIPWQLMWWPVDWLTTFKWPRRQLRLNMAKHWGENKKLKFFGKNIFSCRFVKLVIFVKCKTVLAKV